MMQDWHMGWGGMGFGPILWIGLFVILIVAIVTFTFRSISGVGRSPPREKTPREILDERFARGEIDQSEYDSRRAELER